MNSERWQRIQLLFEEVLAQPAAARSAFIESACGDDAELRGEMVSLLAAHERSDEIEALPTAWLGALWDAEAPGFAAGEQVAGRYLIRRRVGRGGMGEVFEAWDEELSIPVALKTLHLAASTEEARRRLKLEGLLARSVWHPNVCRLYDLGRHGEGEDATWFLTMELLHGETLSERLRDEGRFPLDRALRLAEQMSAGLGAAHRAGVVHRDFKTSNVMLVKKDGGEQAVVTDFGIARAAAQGAAEEDLERGSGPLMGTPAYMAPEQVRGEEVGPAADIYALGIVLYEMVTGTLPFAGDSAIDVARRRLSEEAPSPRSVVPELDERWEKVILRCLAREPRRRFARAEEVGATLAGWAPIEEIETFEITARARHTLPVERDALIGRNFELEELERNLAGTSRLVTLVGTGGMGKTRLAVGYGWGSLGEWSGGVWFCDLTEARSLNGMASTVAGSLGVQFGPGDPLEQLGHAIAGRGRCLIILDNFEQLVDHAAATVGRWLETAGEARFLVTSRERLGLGGHEKVQGVESLSDETALELFTARARWLRPGLEFVAAEAESARELVRLLDGMPLAIELAAARMRMMSAAQIVQQMRRRFKLLTGGGSAHHETLEVAIDGSWELLSPWEQSAWTQCAVFEGGFTLEAAEGVLDLSAWPEAPWVVDIVQSLVDKSLLRTSVPAMASGEGVPATRFGMYVNLQDYARMKLRGVGAAAAGMMVEPDANPERAAEERHGKWYARYGADEFIRSLDRHGGVRLRRQLEREIDNLMAACRRAVERGDERTSADAYRASWAALELRGPSAAAVEVGRQVLANPELRSEERAMTLRTLGQAERHSGQVKEARAHFEAAIAILRETGDRRLEVSVSTNLGGLLQEKGRVVEARTHYGAALAIARELGDRDSEGNILSNLGTLHASQGRMEEARTDLEAALAIHREVGNRRFEGVVLTTLGQLHVDQGRIDEARACLEDALAIHREVGNRRFECTVLITLANLLLDQNHPEEARVRYEGALTIARELGSRRYEGIILVSLGFLLHGRGLLEEARVQYEAALAIHQMTGARRYEGDALCKLAELFHDQGNIEAAREALMKAEEILRSMEDMIGVGRVLCVRVELEHETGDARAARSALAEAEAIASRAGCGPHSMLSRSIAELRQKVTVKP